jgi:hypothetical protein
VTARADDLYEHSIRRLSREERRRLQLLLMLDLATDDVAGQEGERSLLELAGLGAAIWRGVDAQAYVATPRDEWDRRP